MLLTNKELDKYIYQTTGLVILDEDNEEVDPMEEEGFISFEGLLALALIAGTLSSRNSAKQIIHDLPDSISVYQTPIVNSAINQISTIMAGAALSVADDHVPGAMVDIVNRATNSLNVASIPEQDILWLARNRALWASEHFSDNMQNTLRQKMIQKASQYGENPELLGQMLKDMMFNAVDASENFYQVYASNALNYARSYSVVRSGHEMGKTQYRIVAVIDAVTTQLCRNLNNQIFSIGPAMAKFEEIANAESVKDLEIISPMLNHDRTTGDIYYKVGDERNVVDTTDPLALVRIGSMFPPFHLGCRTTIKWL